MNNVLTEETPGKVLGLLALALFATGLMFSVSLTEASFSGTQVALPDPFSPEKVMAAIDTAAAGYSNFLSANFLQPLAASYRVYGDNLAWLSEQTGLTAFVTGSNGSSEVAVEGPNFFYGEVAGATTDYQVADSQESSYV